MYALFYLFDQFQFIFTLVTLIVVGCIADLASMATRVGINKDWVVVIAEGQDYASITELNAMLTRSVVDGQIRVDVGCDGYKDE